MTRARGAEYRAALTRRGLEQLKKKVSTAHERVLAQLDDVTRARIVSATDSTWIPLTDHLAMLDATRGELGDERFRTFCREGMAELWSMPFLEPLLKGVVEVLGIAPDTLLRLSARGWKTSFRNGGTLSYETLGLPRCGVLVLRDFPREHLDSGTFEESVAGCFEAYFDLCGTEGEVSISEQPNELRFIFRWR